MWKFGDLGIWGFENLKMRALNKGTIEQLTTFVNADMLLTFFRYHSSSSSSYYEPLSYKIWFDGIY